MGRTCPDQIGRKLKGEIFNSKDKTDSKVIKINTELLGYIPNTLVEKLVRKAPNMLILLLTVFSLYLCQPHIHYQIHITIQDHTLIILKPIYQHLLVQTNM